MTLVWQQCPAASMATPGLACLSACIQGGSYLVNSTPERLLHGAVTGFVLTGSGRDAHALWPGSAPAQIHPCGLWHLFHYQEYRWGQIQ